LVESLQIIFRISVQTWTWQINLVSACEHDKINIVSVGARVFLQRYFAWIGKERGNFVKLVCFDNGFFCSFWFQLDCFCYRMNNKRIIEFGLRRISELSDLSQRYLRQFRFELWNRIKHSYRRHSHKRLRPHPTCFCMVIILILNSRSTFNCK
jgi:hypothetical protein